MLLLVGAARADPVKHRPGEPLADGGPKHNRRDSGIDFNRKGVTAGVLTCPR